jgi:hypothetical protein
MCRPALAVLRKLSHRPDQARHIAAIGPPAAWARSTRIAPCAALGRYTLPLLPPQPTQVHQRQARKCVSQVDAARHCAAALRRLQAAPQSRLTVHHRLKLTTARSARHCRARARQCPANLKSALPRKKSRFVSLFTVPVDRYTPLGKKVIRKLRHVHTLPKVHKCCHRTDRIRQAR